MSNCRSPVFKMSQGKWSKATRSAEKAWKAHVRAAMSLGTGAHSKWLFLNWALMTCLAPRYPYSFGPRCSHPSTRSLLWCSLWQLSNRALTKALPKDSPGPQSWREPDVRAPRESKGKDTGGQSRRLQWRDAHTGVWLSDRKQHGPLILILSTVTTTSW